ncbi:hypothetical protein LOD99_10044 [Oopsacas minuta]|uniref:Uncharacterized protein n=1 Tax=Oopsacas minuta TaxID=111878 RepID=A0AAV7KK23_9METZ|nr:hypothetical protein LOD99_10044 [Oopsacas minuta]
MTETNASLAALRKELLTVRSDRESMFKGLVEAWKRMGSTEDSLKDGMKFYQNLDKKTLKLFETIKSILPPPPIQQPINPSHTATIPPLDTYKPISPFMSPPDGSARPPVPSRRLKPANQTEDVNNDIEVVDDTELKLLNWAASEQVNKQVNIEPIQPIAVSPLRESTHESSNIIIAQSDPVPKIDSILPSPPKPVIDHIIAPEPQLHIPQVPNLATPVFDTSQLSQLIHSNQSEINRTISSLQSGLKWD